MEVLGSSPDAQVRRSSGLQIAEDVKKYPERSNVGRALTQEEKVHLFEMAATNERWMVAYCAATLAASTTCRGVELKNLKWRDVDLSNETVRVERSKNEAGRRTIPLNEDAVRCAPAGLRERAGGCRSDRALALALPFRLRAAIRST